MEGLSKIISFILGLVVVVVFFAVVTKRIDLKNLGKKTSSTATTVSGTPTPTSKTVSSIKINEPAIPTSIPSAGLPTLFVPTLLAGLFGGSFLRKAGKRD